MNLDLPDLVKDENILVYYKRKRSGQFDDKDYFEWEWAFIDKLVTYMGVHGNQGKLVMDLNFYQFVELIDIKPAHHSQFIHSMSEPFGEEDIEDEIMHYWLNHFNIQFHQLHAWGHMSNDQVISLIRNVQPQTVFPVHTENQHLFRNHLSNVQFVEKRKSIPLA